MAYAYLLLIIAFANDFFALLPSKLPGGIHTSDLGILLIGIGIVFYIVRDRSIGPLANFFTWYVAFYLLLVLAQVAVASLKYSQPIVSGVIAGREQLYYLSFPLFMLALSDLDKVTVFMKSLSAVAVVIIVLSVINYFGPTIFAHERAEGAGERSGIVRAFVPGMNILVIAALWQFWSYLKDNRLFSVNLATFLLIYGGIIFRQTRSRLMAVSAIVALMMVATKRYRMLAAATAVVGLVVLATLLRSESGENMIVNLFVSAVSDLKEGEGTWAVRMEQIAQSWDVFINNFFTGSGGLVIRGTGGIYGFGDLLWVAFAADHGYWVWFKFFGVWGIAYLFALVIGFYFYARRCGRLSDAAHVGRFATYHFACILISLLTINYLTTTHGIIMMCLTWALIVKAAQRAVLDSESEQHILVPARVNGAIGR
jgi:hypothetical protein